MLYEYRYRYRIIYNTEYDDTTIVNAIWLLSDTDTGSDAIRYISDTIQGHI